MAEKNKLLLGKNMVNVIKYVAIILLFSHLIYVGLSFVKYDVEESACIRFARENCVCPDDVEDRKRTFIEEMRERDKKVHKIFPYLKYISGEYYDIHDMQKLQIRVTKLA